jgi:hypothetical protein
MLNEGWTLCLTSLPGLLLKSVLHSRLLLLKTGFSRDQFPLFYLDIPSLEEGFNVKTQTPLNLLSRQQLKTHSKKLRIEGSSEETLPLLSLILQQYVLLCQTHSSGLSLSLSLQVNISCNFCFLFFFDKKKREAAKGEGRDPSSYILWSPAALLPCIFSSDSDFFSHTTKSVLRVLSRSFFKRTFIKNKKTVKMREND